MFNNLSEKLKNIAVVVFIIDLLAGLILGIWISIVDEKFILISIFLIILSSLAGWMFACILYALGLILEKTESVENDTKRLRKSNKNKNCEETVRTHLVDAQDNHTDTTNNVQEYDCDMPASAIETNKNTIVCSKCRYEQPKERTVCWHCGTKFSNLQND